MGPKRKSPSRSKSPNKKGESLDTVFINTLISDVSISTFISALLILIDLIYEFEFDRKHGNQLLHLLYPQKCMMNYTLNN